MASLTSVISSRYAFAAAMSNEFKRINLLCEGIYITPIGPGYPATLGPNQVCTLAGATPGNPIVPGRDYIYASFRFEIAHQWRNWVRSSHLSP
jgi:ATP-binding cassette subfamily G (WHITE) protein 2 (SNQ2)